MANVFEAPQLEVVASTDDFHYVVRDPATGARLAEVRPVLVGEGHREEKGRFKRFLRALPGMGTVIDDHHVPRVICEVSDATGSPIFLVDRADKVIGHPCTPYSAVVAPDGAVVGYLTTEHEKVLRPPTDGPVDPDGTTQVGGRAHVRNESFEVLLDIVMRMDLKGKRSSADDYAGIDTSRLVGGDGTIWARMIAHGPVLHCAPQAPGRLKILLLAHLISRELDERLHMSFVLNSYVSPDPLVPTRDPYPGWRDVHSTYMRYQEEFIEQYKKYKQEIRRRAGAGAS
ncbi:hypothetical protein ACFHW2_21015 [Actinomadura sp. LOL_016]|uniref:hypothetical protein n=1 Tax=unclassified Actinomadura TaxID=2626254 RepID=UPI003A810C99